MAQAVPMSPNRTLCGRIIQKSPITIRIGQRNRFGDFRFRLLGRRYHVELGGLVADQFDREIWHHFKEGTSSMTISLVERRVSRVLVVGEAQRTDSRTIRFRTACNVD